MIDGCRLHHPQPAPTMTTNIKGTNQFPAGIRSDSFDRSVGWRGLPGTIHFREQVVEVKTTCAASIPEFGISRCALATGSCNENRTLKTRCADVDGPNSKVGDGPRRDCSIMSLRSLLRRFCCGDSVRVDILSSAGPIGSNATPDIRSIANPQVMIAVQITVRSISVKANHRSSGLIFLPDDFLHWHLASKFHMFDNYS